MLRRKLLLAFLLAILFFPLSVWPQTRVFGFKDKPAPRTADRNFWALTAATGAATVLDVELTQHCLHTELGCRERNPIFGPQPSRARMYGVVAGENFACAYLAYRLKKSQHRRLRRLWWVPQTVAIAGHGKGFAVTLRLMH